jgi:hypothetical protein
VSKHQFSSAERYAVFETHGARCYMCAKPVNYADFQVDHVIPESLEDKPDRLKKALDDLGRSADFQINSHENWLPACGPCNNKKRSTVWEPSGLVQLHLQKAAKKAGGARAAAEEIVSDLKLTRSLNTLGRALDAGGLAPSLLEELDVFVERYSLHRAPEAEPDVVRITAAEALPLYEVLTTDGGRTQLARGPYGVGGGPLNASPAMRCTCGSPFFNGTRCVLCGQQLDD